MTSMGETGDAVKLFFRVLPMNVPSKRAYASPLRDDQARATHRAIVAASAELFQRNGYAATTIDAIAAAAGVSRKTVFASGGSKFRLLKDAFDWSLVGDDQPIPMADREPVHRQPAVLLTGRLTRLPAADHRHLVPLLEEVADAPLHRHVQRIRMLGEQTDPARCRLVTLCQGSLLEC